MSPIHKAVSGTIHNSERQPWRRGTTSAWKVAAVIRNLRVATLYTIDTIAREVTMKVITIQLPSWRRDDDRTVHDFCAVSLSDRSIARGDWRPLDDTDPARSR